MQRILVRGTGGTSKEKQIMTESPVDQTMNSISVDEIGSLTPVGISLESCDYRDAGSFPI